ncbi:hypothetical protein LHK_02518 [Laribacter hongkongensis HLHK9]|uniref:Uncharacterized protein n=1 Tax=Laribacter hongkongensis (strain HLHK9) TaxID=557598 RepID=C1DBU7_LARHH|nr:hypothetical protein LHK_02518 [Laribacter hongkongensis HLHK9]
MTGQDFHTATPYCHSGCHGRTGRYRVPRPEIAGTAREMLRTGRIHRLLA